MAILGAGGTARAAVAAARELGADEVTVYARRPEAVQANSAGWPPSVGLDAAPAAASAQRVDWRPPPTW